MENNYYGGKKKKKNIAFDIDEKTGHGWHSRPYHRYFEDFAEYEVTDKNGKTKIIRSYAGTRYLACADAKTLIRKKILIALLWLICAGVFVFATTREIVANATWYVAIFVFAVIVLMVWNLISIIEYFTAKGAMAVFKFKRSVMGFRRSSQIVFIAYLCCALATVAAIIFTNTIRLWSWISVAGFVVCAAIMFLSNFIERGIVYEEKASEEVQPEDAVYIE
ncbi:MAG: hypothetical protein ACOX75_04925 [Lachnospiraceae bacterium]|jgi:hypothetical protein